MQIVLHLLYILAGAAALVCALAPRKWQKGVLAAVAIVAWLFAGGNAIRQVTVEAGSQSVDANDFIRIHPTNSAVFVSDLSTIDLNQPDEYPVKVRFCGLTYSSVLRVVDTTAPTAALTDVTRVSVEVPAAQDFITEVQDVTPVTVSFVNQPDMTLEGDQPVELLLTDSSGNTSTVTGKLTVFFDRQAPVIEGVEPLRTYLGETPDYLGSITTADDIDTSPVLTVDDSWVDVNQSGHYCVLYRSVDASGNETVYPAIVQVIEDVTAPVIYGAKDISLYTGSTVSYRSSIQLVDDTDPNPTLSIDASGVDLSKPGSYKVTYTATDVVGNSSSVTVKVTVYKNTRYYIDESVIYAAVDELLAKIITDDMTDVEKVKAIYDYMHNNYYYTNRADKTDWMQAAYRLMHKHTGNCYSFYALSRLMFDRLGYPNMRLERVFNYYRPFNHYWNLVSLDGGQTWYHFDATPRSLYMDNMYLMTDADLDWYDANLIRGYYMRDDSLYPATPEESPVNATEE